MFDTDDAFRPRTVLVTGGTGALGPAVVAGFLAGGWSVAVASRRAREMNHLVAESVLMIEADATEEAAVSRAVDTVIHECGSVDALVHLVGTWSGGELVENHSPESWRAIVDVNLYSAFLYSRAVLPLMRQQRWGRIVFLASRAAFYGRSRQSAYAVAKAALGVLAEAIAEETQGAGITANVVAPGVLDTPKNRFDLTAADGISWVSIESVAASIVFLCSEEAGELRGAWLPVYGST